jgi:F0F1-type ATP synthase membrane subunit b/b'
MEGSTSFNPGFLGSSFNWWIGQVADDSVWRDNILSGKYAASGQVPGWGRRYKVRIIGLHDQGETTIPSEDLPWAQVMYPVTAGGGQAESLQTANLRQGNMVFGFFIDGQEMQVPVIMGILGNNSQSALAPTIGNSRVTDTQNGSLNTSGIARGKIQKKESEREVLPDEALQTTKPGISPYTLIPSPKELVDEYGLTAGSYNSSIVKQYFNDATNLANNNGLSGEEFTNFVKKSVRKKLDKQNKQEASPLSPPQSGATKEHVDGIHQLENAGVKRDDKYKQKIPMMKADNQLESAVKNIQTVVDNLISKIDKYLQTFQSYVEAVSNTVQNIRKEIENAASAMAKYMKMIYDKIAEYIIKTVNQGLTAVVSTIPSSFRHLFADVKEQMTQLTYCLYSKIIQKLAGQILSKLQDSIDLDGLEQKAKQQVLNGSEFQTAPRVPMCYAEDIVASTIRSTITEVNSANDQLLSNLESFVGEIQSEIASITNQVDGITKEISKIVGSISGAMNFTNIKLSVFGCDLSPNLAVSDFYTLDGGSGGQSHSQLPSAESINNGSTVPEDSSSTTAKEQYATPPKGQPNVDYKKEPETRLKPTS